MLRAGRVNGFINPFKKMCAHLLSNKDKKGLELYLKSFKDLQFYFEPIQNEIVCWLEDAITDNKMKDVNFILKYGLSGELPCPRERIIKTALNDDHIWFRLVKIECKNYYKTEWRKRSEIYNDIIPYFR